MVIEKLLKEIVDEYDQAKVKNLFDLLLDSWLYFYFNEQPGRDSRVSDGNVISILQVDKEKPIMVPLIKNEHGCNGVLYTNSEFAKTTAESDCKIAKMKCRDVFGMFYRMRGVDSVYIQGNYGNILPSRNDLAMYGEIV